MDGWMDGWLDGWIGDGLMDVWLGAWMVVWMVGWMDEWMAGWVRSNCYIKCGVTKLFIYSESLEREKKDENTRSIRPYSGLYTSSDTSLFQKSLVL
jgi:hypothetical protein